MKMQKKVLTKATKAAVFTIRYKIPKTASINKLKAKTCGLNVIE